MFSTGSASYTQQVMVRFSKQFDHPKVKMISNFEKYNQQQVLKAEITTEATTNLLNHDKKIAGMPKFISDFLELKPSQHRETLFHRPELITWSPDNLYLILPNPSVSDHDAIMKNPKDAKHNLHGFGLVVWFVHPALLQKSRFSEKDQVLKNVIESGESLRYGTYVTKERLLDEFRTNTLKRVESFSELLERDADKEPVGDIVERSGITYLSGPFDYKPEDLTSLMQLKKHILAHLTQEYGVDESDKVDMYFHSHYSVTTTTMHMHVRINQAHHGLELDKSISLDEIIACLENNIEIKEYYKEQRGCVHKELSSKTFFEKIGYKVSSVANPYFVENKEPNKSGYKIRK